MDAFWLGNKARLSVTLSCLSETLCWLSNTLDKTLSGISNLNPFVSNFDPYVRWMVRTHMRGVLELGPYKLIMTFKTWYMCLSWRPLHSMFISYWVLIWSFCHCLVSIDMSVVQLVLAVAQFCSLRRCGKLNRWNWGNLYSSLRWMIWLYKWAQKICYINWISLVFSLCSCLQSWAFWLSRRMAAKIPWELWVFFGK